MLGQDSFSCRFQKALEIRGLKQSDIVRLTGIGKSAISQYLSGVYEPKQKNIFLLARALNVSEPWLMGLDAPMEREKPTAMSDDELWNAIRSDDSKLMLARWISNLDRDQLQMVVKLLEAARLSPNE